MHTHIHTKRERERERALKGIGHKPVKFYNSLLPTPIGENMKTYSQVVTSVDFS